MNIWLITMSKEWNSIPHLHIFTQDGESASSNLGEKRASFSFVDWLIDYAICWHCSDSNLVCCSTVMECQFASLEHRYSKSLDTFAIYLNAYSQSRISYHNIHVHSFKDEVIFTLGIRWEINMQSRSGSQWKSLCQCVWQCKLTEAKKPLLPATQVGQFSW